MHTEHETNGTLDGTQQNDATQQQYDNTTPANPRLTEPMRKHLAHLQSPAMREKRKLGVKRAQARRRKAERERERRAAMAKEKKSQQRLAASAKATREQQTAKQDMALERQAAPIHYSRVVIEKLAEAVTVSVNGIKITVEADGDHHG